MSTLEELRIGGIRNFGSDAEEQQKIRFATPLTLIVGANGCGKTTIIECIKYALTGDYPPNSQNGQNFINDPKQSGLNETRGFVKLKVRNVNAGETSVARGVKLSNVNKKPKLQTEDATLVMMVGDKETVLSKRKDEATEIMCEAMGVSKAIINYVLFCHQEESDWPLSTDLDVMNRFDKIFGTTEYNTALEKLRKKRKEIDMDVKEKKVGLKELEMNKKHADRKTMELSLVQEKLVEREAEYKTCDEEIKPLQKELTRILEIQQNLNKLTEERTKVETEYKNKVENRQKILKNIKEQFDDTTVDELETKLRTFKAEMGAKEQEARQSKTKLEREKNNYEDLNKKLKDLECKQTALMAQIAQQQDLFAEKADYIRVMCRQLNIEITFDLNNDNDGAEKLAKQAETGIVAEEKRIEKLQKDNDQAQTAHEQHITEMQNKKVSIEATLKMNREQLKEFTSEHSTLTTAIEKIELEATKQDDVAQRIRQLQEKSDNPAEREALERMRDTILVNQTQSAEVNTEIEKLDDQIGVLSKNATVLAQIDAKAKQLEKNEQDIRRFRNKHADYLAELLNGEAIERNYKQRVEQVNQRKRTEIDRIEKEMRINDNKLSECLHSHKIKKQELTRLETRATELADKIYESCQSMPYAEVLAETKENAAKAQMEHSAFQSAKLFYKDYIEKIRKKPCCPLCHKDLNGNEADDLNEELNGQIESLPAKIRRTEQAFKETNEKLETLLTLQSIVEEVESLRVNRIPTLKRELGDIETKRATAQTEKTKLEKSLEQPKQHIEIGQRMVGDMSLLDDALREAERTRNDVNQLKATLPEIGGDGLSLDDAQVKRKSLSDQKRKIDAETRSTEQNLKSAEDKLGRLQKSLFALKELEIKLKANIQSLDQKRNRLKELATRIAELKTKIDESEKSLLPIRRELQMSIDTKELEKKKNAQQLKVEQVKLNELKQTANSVNRCRTEIAKLIAQKLEQKIAEIEAKVVDVKRVKDALKTTIETIQRTIDVLNKEMADQGAVERNLQDNLDLLRLDAEMAMMKETLDELIRDGNEIDFEAQNRTKDRLYRQLEQQTNKRNLISGQISAIQDQITRTQEELSESQYKNAGQNYRRAFYEKIVMEKIISDLETYCRTLEHALTQYHQEKMTKINRLIRELWRSIYKGNDIDYIEINTEEVKGSTKKRSYTYRVMQSKNDTKSIMRGNCSAGQRVLACLVIRIALAETFSANCGVLALDEPTTNLDKLNITSLVDELKRFIDERAYQQNFMLIVITHDEEFIQGLGRSDSYHRVSRNASGKSEIQKYRVR